MEKSWINKDECLTALGIPESLFDQLIEEGFVPEGLKYSHRTILWERRVIDAAAVLLPGLMKALGASERTKK